MIKPENYIYCEIASGFYEYVHLGNMRLHATKNGLEVVCGRHSLIAEGITVDNLERINQRYLKFVV